MNMASTIFIVWRESIEAMLVIGILYTWLKNQIALAQPEKVKNSKQGMQFLWAGVLGGIVLAVVLAMVMLKIQSELASDALAYFQLAIVLIAALLITQMVLWMRRRGRTLKRDLESGLQQAHDKANWLGMAILAAIAVGREGAETVIFLYGTGLAQQNDLIVFILSAIAGFLLAFFSFWLLSQGSRWLSWQVFFRFSEILLLFLAASLLVDGVDQMIGFGWLPALVDPLWDSSFLLDDSSQVGGVIAAFTGYRAQPALMLILIYCSYWLMIRFLFMRGNKEELAINTEVRA
jgi:high-affinity iron transporter